MANFDHLQTHNQEDFFQLPWLGCLKRYKTRVLSMLSVIKNPHKWIVGTRQNFFKKRKEMSEQKLMCPPSKCEYSSPGLQGTDYDTTICTIIYKNVNLGLCTSQIVSWHYIFYWEIFTGVYCSDPVTNDLNWGWYTMTTTQSRESKPSVTGEKKLLHLKNILSTRDLRCCVWNCACIIDVVYKGLFMQGYGKQQLHDLFNNQTGAHH